MFRRVRDPYTSIMAERQRERLEGPRILLVDDDPLIRETMAGFIRARGAHVVLAGSAIAALNALRLRDFDVLVSDIQMPTRDGFWLIREVRATP